MTEERSYPLDIRGDLSPDLSRWLWLVKWLLAMPHFIVLIFLSLAAFVVWIISWWAILFTARYPRGMFNYIVGVMRWWWRVSFYAFYPLATDRYPPFSLKSNDDYPADLYVEYPERLSRVKVIFKWWLLAIPHYIVVMLFTGMQILLDNNIDAIAWTMNYLQSADAVEYVLVLMPLIISLPFAAIAAVGLMGVLVLIAAVTLLFRGRYPTDIFELVMRMQRWSYRVSGYSGLLYDNYPPFRLKP